MVQDDPRGISPGEGNTPLIGLDNMPRDVGKDIDVYIKPVRDAIPGNMT